MGKIKIYFGIYEFNCTTPFHFEGFNHTETREPMIMSLKLKQYLLLKGIKFQSKYDIHQFAFTLGVDPENHIEVVAVVHPIHDKFDPEIAEDIVIGRIKRMRGEIRKPYNLEERYSIKHKDGTISKGELKYPYIYKLTKEGDQ
ncbi:MAG: hypothetical protein ACFFG0_36660 [Candidatus Thorarchaeota archaeon]